MTAPYIPRPRTLEEALRAAFMPAIAADATATPPVRPDFSGVPMATMRGTSAPMPRAPQSSGNPAADRLNARVDRGLALLGRQAAPSADTPEGWLREMFNPVAAGRGTREMANATGAQMRRAGRTGNVSDAAMAAGLGGLTLASAIPGGPADDAARVVAGQSDDVVRGARAQAGGQVAKSNGFFYKGGQFLPSTSEAPGKWKVGNKTVKAKREQVGPSEYEMQPTPFSRSLYSLAGVGHGVTRGPDGKLVLVDRPVKDALGNVITRESPVRPGVAGVMMQESMTLGEIIDAYNSGQRWLSVRPYDVQSGKALEEVAQSAPTPAMQSPTPEASVIRNALVPQAPDAPAGIRAYHGTPHRFAPEPGHPLGRFRMDKLGTGEGAQMYGHGLYFADDLAVAKTYSPRNPKYESALMREYQAAERAGDYDALEVFESALMHRTPEQLRSQFQDPMYARALAKVEKLSKPGTHGIYEVAIDASPDDLLDWDAPMSQQPDGVLRALGLERSREATEQAFERLSAEAQAAGKSLSDEPFKSQVDALHARLDRTVGTAAVPDVTGGQFYRSDGEVLFGSADEFRQRERGRSEWLREQGIPGIKYLDGDSRASGQGTRNYVIWDESKIRILKALAAAGMVSPAALASAEAAYAQQQQERP